MNDTEMTSEASQTLDHGLGALVMLLRFQGIGIDPKQIRNQFAATPMHALQRAYCVHCHSLRSAMISIKKPRLTESTAARAPGRTTSFGKACSSGNERQHGLAASDTKVPAVFISNYLLPLRNRLLSTKPQMACVATIWIC